VAINLQLSLKKKASVSITQETASQLLKRFLFSSLSLQGEVSPTDVKTLGKRDINALKYKKILPKIHM